MTEVLEGGTLAVTRAVLAALCDVSLLVFAARGSSFDMVPCGEHCFAFGGEIHRRTCVCWAGGRSGLE